MAYRDCLVACSGPSSDGGTADAGATDAGPPAGGSCEEYCYQVHPMGLPCFAELSACLLVHCSAAGLCEGNQPPNACTQCITANCAEEYANENATTDGFLLGACQFACDGGGTCDLACSNKYPGAKKADDALLACFSAKCAGC
jgi:hypothetical protein